MKTKKYFEKALTLKTKIESYNAEIKSLQDLSSIIQTDKVQTTQKADAIPNAVIKITKLREKINKKIDELVDLKANISEQIEQIDDDKIKLMLRYRYIEEKTTEEISDKTTYTKGYVQNLLLKGYNILDNKRTADY